MDDRAIIFETIQMLKGLEKAESESKEYFECPLCGGTVKWGRLKQNNHIHLTCDSCGFEIDE